MLIISVEERFNWLKQNKHKTSIKTSRVAHGYVVSMSWKSKTYILLVYGKVSSPSILFSYKCPTATLPPKFFYGCYFFLKYF